MNDNAPPPRPEAARLVPIIGVVSGGRVTITDSSWVATPTPAIEAEAFPNDPREP